MKFYSETLSRRFDNGLEAYILPRPGGTVMAECYIKTGSIHEGEQLGCGLSHFLEHMLFQGCRNYPGTAAADTLQNAGCQVNAYTSFDRTVYHSRGPGEKLPLILDVISSMVRYPELPEKRFLAERDVILREYDRTRDDPGRRLQEELFKLMYQRHPLRYPVIGQREMISQVTAEMAGAYHARRYTPGRCFWVITGNVDPEEAFALIEEKMGDWQNTFLAEPPIALPELRLYAPRSTEFVFPDTVSRLSLGVRLEGDLQKQMPKLDVLFGLLGMGAGSRLNRKFELETELALSLRTFCYTLPGGGAAGVTAVTTPAKLKKLEAGLKKELEKVVRGDISASEVNREKKQQYAEHLRQLEELEHISAIIGAGVMECGNPELGDVYQEELARTTHEEVIETARNVLDATQFCTVRQLTGSAQNKKTAVRKKEDSLKRLDCQGIPLLLIPEKTIPLVHFSLILPGGTLFEAQGRAGEAKLTAALLGAGTQKRDEIALLTALDRCGADLSINCGANSLAVELDAPRKSFQQAAELLAELLTTPLFGQREFERERTRLAEALASRKTAALETAFDQAREMLLGSHPYANGLAGRSDTLKNLTVQDLERFYQRSLSTRYASAGFSGCLSEEEAQTWGNRILAALPWHNQEPPFPALPVFPGKNLFRETKLEREQAAATVMVPGQSFSDPLHHQIFMLLSMAENGLSSKLFKKVREDNALAYSVGMDMAGGFHPGWFAFYAQTRSDQAKAATDMLIGEIRRLGETGLSEEEFQNARERTAFKLLRNQDSTAGRLSSALLELFYDRNALLDTEAELAHLRRMTCAEANQIIIPAFENAFYSAVNAGNIG